MIFSLYFFVSFARVRAILYKGVISYSVLSLT